MTTDPIKALVETAQEWCDAVDRGTSWDYWDHHFKDMKYKVLPAAIEALKPMADVVMVPREPTEEICNKLRAVLPELFDTSDDTLREIYTDILAASPASPVPVDDKP